MNSMMEYKGYHAKITYDADNEILIGEVTGTQDSLSFHGASVPELKQKFADCIENYLDLCERLHKSPDPDLGKHTRDSYKVQQLVQMLSHETYPAEEHYGAHLTHWYGDAKPLTIDAGGLKALVDYYSGYHNTL